MEILYGFEEVRSRGGKLYKMVTDERLNTYEVAVCPISAIVHNNPAQKSHLWDILEHLVRGGGDVPIRFISNTCNLCYVSLSAYPWKRPFFKVWFRWDRRRFNFTPHVCQDCYLAFCNMRDVVIQGSRYHFQNYLGGILDLAAIIKSYLTV